MSEETVNCPKKVVRCDVCGEQGEREDYEGRPHFITCAVCKKDFCWGCYSKKNNSIVPLREMYDWTQTESFVCADCAAKLVSSPALQEGVDRYVTAKVKLAVAEAEFNAARGLIKKVIQEASK